MDVIEVNVLNQGKNNLPEYSTKGSAGFDLRANLEEPVVIKPGERKLISTGLKVSLPIGYEMQIRPRSGLALKRGISLVNSPGTIDSDYRGDIGIIIINHGDEDFVVNNGDRIAQGVIAKYTLALWNEVGLLDSSEREDGGFGHTGVK